LYSIIYDAINEIKAAMEGMLAPEFEEKIVANVEIRETFKIKPETEITEDVANVLLSAKNLELAARQAFSEATSAQKQVTAFMDILTKDPMSLLTDPRMPFNFEDLAIDFIAEKLRLEQMTPAERRALELEKENKRYREEREKENSEKSKQQFEQETEQHMNSFANGCFFHPIQKLAFVWFTKLYIYIVTVWAARYIGL
jgi:hypothetical protein